MKFKIVTYDDMPVENIVAGGKEITLKNLIKRLKDKGFKYKGINDKMDINPLLIGLPLFEGLSRPMIDKEYIRYETDEAHAALDNDRPFKDYA